MAAQMCALQPTSPLPLDRASAEGVYELMKENTLPSAVKELLDSVDSFVGRHLNVTQTDEDANCFCAYHSEHVKQAENPKALEDMWVLQRDISVQLFKVMMGVVRSASDLARKLRSYDHSMSYKLDDSDLELAFNGDARGGYQWLNCLAKDECGWVWSAINDEDESLQPQCPACLLGRAVDSETTIRLLITAARLLKWDFFVTSIQEHLENDPWWGPGYWESIEPKASILGNQIRELLKQCSEIRQTIEQRNCSMNAHKNELMRTTNSSSRRVTSHGVFDSPAPVTTLPMRLGMRQLHAMADMLAASGRTRNADRVSSNALRPYNHARMANNHRLAAYCWFVLMYNVSLGPAPAVPSDGEHLQQQYQQDNRATRHKMRARTV